MLDIKVIRKNVEKVKKAVAAKREKANIDKILELDEIKRKKLVEVEELKRERNEENEKIALAKRSGQDVSETIANKMSQISDTIKGLDTEISSVDAELESLLLWVPNMAMEDVPEGDETCNKIIRSWGEPKKHAFPAKPHWELGENLGIFE